MNTNQITSQTAAYPAAGTGRRDKNTPAESARTTASQASKNEDSAVVWEKNSTDKAAHNNAKNKNYVTLTKEHQNVIAQLKADAEERSSQLRSLVESMLTRQNQTFAAGTLTDEKMYELLRKGQVTVTPEVRAQAQKDIAEDGYWGVEQTSERLFSFAKAISGGDTSKLDKLISAMEKGFQQATKSWGDELPELCKKTLEAAKEKLNQWAAESREDSTKELSEATASAMAGQAAASRLSE